MVKSSKCSSTKGELLKFYRDNPPDVSMISDLNRRHFRMVLQNGSFMKIPDVIRTGKDLHKWLLRLAPLDVYYSTACWLNPTTIKPRPKKDNGEFLQAGIILSHDIVFDIDVSPFSRSNLESARRSCLDLYDIMRDRDYELKYIAFSGAKGFHVVLKDKAHTTVTDPYEREMRLISSRKQVVEDIRALNIGIDSAVTCDTRRIFRLPGTINSRTGYACTVLTRTQLEMNIKDLIGHIPHLGSARPVPYFRLTDIGIAEHLRRITSEYLKKYLGTARYARHTGEHCYTTYLLSSVPGVKGRHTVLLSFSNRSLDRVGSVITDLVKRYRLTDVHIFGQGNEFRAIALKTVQRNRLQKIMDHANADNAHLLRKYNVTSIRIGPLVNDEQEEIEPPISYLKTIPGMPEANETAFVSAGHLNFLNKCSACNYDHPNRHGSGEFKVIDAVIRL